MLKNYLVKGNIDLETLEKSIMYLIGLEKKAKEQS